MATARQWVGLAHCAIAGHAQHRTLAYQRLDARHAELGGFFDQSVHALVGRHADGQRHSPRELTFDGIEVQRAHPHLAPRDGADAAGPLAAAAIEQRERVAGLQAQHLHVAGGGGAQRELGTRRQRPVDVNARHGHGHQVSHASTHSQAASASA